MRTLLKDIALLFIFLIHNLLFSYNVLLSKTCTCKIYRTYTGGIKMKRVIKYIAALVLGVFLLAACSSPDSENTSTTAGDSGQSGGILNIGLAANPSNLDPIKYTGVYESNVIRQMGDTLVIYNEDYSGFEPNLATDWSVSEDGMVYTFNLRDDVDFQPGEYQDGRQMTAEDVKYSLERTAFESALNRLTGLDHVEVIDDFTVAIHLTTPNAPFMNMLTDPGNVIVPKEEVEGWGDQFGQHFVGTGPFALENFTAGQRIDLARNENYWGETSNLDGVSFRVIEDETQMSNSLLAGDIHIATDVRGQSREIIEQAEEVELISVPGFSVNYIDMNNVEGPTADPQVRQAIIMATDKEEIIQGVNQWGGAEPSLSPIPPASWGYPENPEELTVDFNPEAAKELLAEAGYPDGFEIDFYTSEARIPYATIFQAQMKENLNIDVNLHPQEWGTYSETVASGKAGMNLGGWSWGPDPYFYLNKLFHSDEIGALGNGKGYSNPEVDALLDEAQAETDQEVRYDLYQQALEIIMSEYPRIELESSEKADGVSNSVEGYSVRADNSIVIVANDGTNVSLVNN